MSKIKELFIYKDKDSDTSSKLYPAIREMWKKTLETQIQYGSASSFENKNYIVHLEVGKIAIFFQ